MYQVSAYGDRDAVTHQAIAVEMLFKATLGNDSHRHREWSSFADAFGLPCSNGFRFTEVCIYLTLVLTGLM